MAELLNGSRKSVPEFSLIVVEDSVLGDSTEVDTFSKADGSRSELGKDKRSHNSAQKMINGHHVPDSHTIVPQDHSVSSDTTNSTTTPVPDEVRTSPLSELDSTTSSSDLDSDGQTVGQYNRLISPDDLMGGSSTVSLESPVIEAESALLLEDQSSDSDEQSRPPSTNDSPGLKVQPISSGSPAISSGVHSPDAPPLVSPREQAEEGSKGKITMEVLVHEQDSVLSETDFQEPSHDLQESAPSVVPPQNDSSMPDEGSKGKITMEEPNMVQDAGKEGVSDCYDHLEQSSVDSEATGGLISPSNGVQPSSNLESSDITSFPTVSTEHSVEINEPSVEITEPRIAMFQTTSPLQHVVGGAVTLTVAASSLDEVSASEQDHGKEATSHTDPGGDKVAASSLDEVSASEQDHGEEATSRTDPGDDKVAASSLDEVSASEQDHGKEATSRTDPGGDKVAASSLDEVSASEQDHGKEATSRTDPGGDKVAASSLDEVSASEQDHGKEATSRSDPGDDKVAASSLDEVSASEQDHGKEATSCTDPGGDKVAASSLDEVSASEQDHGKEATSRTDPGGDKVTASSLDEVSASEQDHGKEATSRTDPGGDKVAASSLDEVSASEQDHGKEATSRTDPGDDKARSLLPTETSGTSPMNFDSSTTTVPQSPHSTHEDSSNLDRSTPTDASNLDSGLRSTKSDSPPEEDFPRLEPLSPTHNGLSERYEYLRRTLSHSRSRYSTRRRNQHQESGTRALHLRHTMREGARQSEVTRHSERTSQSEGVQTVEGMSAEQHTIGQLRDILKDSGRDSVERHVDHHGRTYYMDHNTRTVAYGRRQSLTSRAGGDPEMRARREMLDRRYQSLQRSFHGERSAGRPIPGHPHTQTPLSPIMSANNLSLRAGEAEELSQGMVGPPPKPKRQRDSSKTNRWLFFGRKSKKQILPQGLPGSGDDVLPISPVSSSPPSIDDAMIPPSPTTSLDQSTRSQSVESPRESRSRSSSSRGEEIEEPLPRRVERERLRLVSEGEPVSDESGPFRMVEILSEQGVSEERPPSEDASPVTSQISRQHSIVRTGRITETDRDAALHARHRVRATIMGSTVWRHSHEPGGQRKPTEGGQMLDTDEETNEDIPSRHSTISEVSALEEKEAELVERERSESQVVSKKRTLHPGLKNCPALKFITRRDLYSFLSSAGDAGEEFFANRALMELVQRIRADNSLFDKYQHSRQLVMALNKFVDDEADVPEEWEKKLNKEGKVFFIDHTNRLTTFIDPRLPLPDQQFSYTTPASSLPAGRRVQTFTDEEPSVRPHHQTTVVHSHTPVSTPPSNPPPVTPDNQLSYEDQVVAFFRQPEVGTLIARRYQRGIRPQLRDMIEDIRMNGSPALERIQMSGSVATYELALVLSLFEEEINHIRPQPLPQPQQQPTPSITIESSQNFSKSTLQRKKEAFSSKLQNFKVMMMRLGFAQSSRLKFNIRRDHLLEDAYEHIMRSDVRHLMKKRLNISFRGEEGLDYGGPSREFFFLLSREVFNPYYGLFEYSANDTYTVQISPTSSFIQNNVDWFRFAGRVIGLVMVQGFLLDVFFTRAVYKSLLRRPFSLKDLESLELAFYNSLIWIQENDPEPLDLTFTVEEEAFGQLTTHELKPGGMDIPVTDENKDDYIDLMIRWRLDRGVAEQMENLKKGFSEVLPVNLLQGFDAQELEFITAGTLEIDVDDWRNHTEYRNGYHASHPVILWFWQAVEMFDNEQRLRLLQFVTGTSSVPFEGFKALRGSNGPKRFTIDYFSDIRSLPRSHTCFNRVDLPPYPSFEVLYEKLRIAVEEGNTFGIE